MPAAAAFPHGQHSKCTDMSKLLHPHDHDILTVYIFFTVETETEFFIQPGSHIISFKNAQIYILIRISPSQKL